MFHGASTSYAVVATKSSSSKSGSTMTSHAFYRNRISITHRPSATSGRNAAARSSMPRRSTSEKSRSSIHLRRCGVSSSSQSHQFGQSSLSAMRTFGRKLPWSSAATGKLVPRNWRKWVDSVAHPIRVLTDADRTRPMSQGDADCSGSTDSRRQHRPPFASVPAGPKEMPAVIERNHASSLDRRGPRHARVRRQTPRPMVAETDAGAELVVHCRSEVPSQFSFCHWVGRFNSARLT